MNHSSPGSLALDKAIIGFLNYKTSEGLTDRSVDSYKRILEKWAEHTGEIDRGRITQQSVSDHLLFMMLLHGLSTKMGRWRLRLFLSQNSICKKRKAPCFIIRVRDPVHLFLEEIKLLAFPELPFVIVGQLKLGYVYFVINIMKPCKCPYQLQKDNYHPGTKVRSTVGN